jgi:hypothetical protein
MCARMKASRSTFWPATWMAAVCEREVRALRAAAAEHRGARLHLITLDARIGLELPRSIGVHDAADWLLSIPPHRKRG